MDQVKVEIKDQFGQKYIVTAFLNKLDDESLSIVKKIDRILVNDEMIMPNVDLLYGSQENGRIFKVLGLAD